jgi:protease secretion system membrane fusion protein
MGKILAMKTDAGDVAAPEAALIGVETDSSFHSRLGWLIVLLGVGGFFVWALFAPLDKGVPVPGTVTVATNRKAVQHLSGGTVQDIHVKEGDAVKAGQVLVSMNDVQVKANAEMTRVQYFTARAAEARLIAERDGQPSVVFPAELLNARHDSRVVSNMTLQGQLFASRQASLQSELAGIDESIAGLGAQLEGLQAALDSQKQQLAFLKEQLDGVRDLAREGYVARNRLLELERTYAQVNGGMSENIGNIGRAQRQIAELRLRRVQRQQDYQKEVRTQLSEVQKEAEALENRLKGLDFDLGNALVRAPVDGVVMGMNVFTRGGVVSPGFRMMDVVPSDDPLVVEGEVPVHLIDKLHPGLEVEMVFAAFNQNETPHIPGIVTQVSADRLVNEQTGVPYYKLKAQVAPEGMEMISHHQVRPGMPVEVFVRTGERTLMSYLLKPLFDRVNTALTEE